MTRLRRFRKKRRFGPAPVSKNDESVRRKLNLSARGAPPTRDPAEAASVAAPDGGEPNGSDESIPPTTPAAADITGVQPAVFRGPTRDLGQDPFVVQRTLERLRVEHAELWLTANELKDRLHEVTRDNGELEAAARRYKDLFHLAPDALLLTDRSGLVHDCNFAAGRLLRVDPGAVVGQRMKELVQAADLHLLAEALALVSSGRTANVELRLAVRKAPSALVRLRGCPVLTQVDDVLWVLGT